MVRWPIVTLSVPSQTQRALAWDLPEAIYIALGTGEFVDVNRAFLDLVGADGLASLQRVPPERLWVNVAARTRHLSEAVAAGGVVETELDLLRLDGDHRVVVDRCAFVEGPDGSRLLVGALHDVTELRGRETELQRQAVRDPLTGSYNRRYLSELEPVLEATETQWGVVIIDLDHFKQYNDERGHQAGDDVLVRTARFLMQQLRAEDVVIRIGGDEFIALLFGEDTAYTEEVTHRLERAAVDDAPAPFSLGWSLRQGNEPLAATISRADKKLIHVKVHTRDHSTRRHPPRPSGPVNRATVLVVDEDAAIRGAVRRYIEYDGYIVVDAADGETALDALYTHDVSLAFVDVGKGPDDAEILTALRAKEPSLALVAMSGVDEVLETVQAKYGPLYILPKPFAMDRFTTILRIVLR